jgi:uncharacterized protein
MRKFNRLDAVIRTESGNNYHVNRKIPQVLLIHPILKFLIELKESGKLELWLNDLHSRELDEIELETGYYASKRDILFYNDYLVFLNQKGYFEEVEKHPMTPISYNAEDVKRELVNSGQIIFEVTESCNLDCKYCGFGELYLDSYKRENKHFDLNIAFKVLDYMKDLFESPLNRKHCKKISIGFYGGEPLLNMSFIEEIVRYANQVTLTNKIFNFTMTTNGILLDKYMDFLAENNFLISISLDGNEKNSEYRHFPDGSASFHIVYNNLLKFKKKYPDYFMNSINFLSVLHNKNSNKEVRSFFKKEFQKTPRLTEISASGIKPKKKDEYEKISNTLYRGITPEEIIADTNKKDRILTTPSAKPLWNFLSQYCGYVFRKYDNLQYESKQPWIVGTGTCIPFSKKIFITAKGMILPCERIPYHLALGHVDENGVHLDFEKVAKQYNRYYENLMEQCNNCSNSDSCPYCIFTMDIDDEHPICNSAINYNQLKENLKSQLLILEETPQYYTEILKNYHVN